MNVFSHSAARNNALNDMNTALHTEDLPGLTKKAIKIYYGICWIYLFNFFYQKKFTWD